MIRWRLGWWLADLADWLRYPPLATCDQCGYVRDSGVHESVDECKYCRINPERRAEHHSYRRYRRRWWRR